MNIKYALETVDFQSNKDDFASIVLCQPYWELNDLVEKNGLYFITNQEKNDSFINKYLNISKKNNASLVILPELAVPEKSIPAILEWSIHNSTIVIAGSHYKKSEKGYKNISPIIFNGSVYYSEKIIPSPIEKSAILNDSLISGEKIIVFKNTKIGNFAVLVCADYLEDKITSDITNKHHLDFIFVTAFSRNSSLFHNKMNQMCKLSEDGLYIIYCNNLLNDFGNGKSAFFGILDKTFLCKLINKTTNGTPETKLIEFSSQNKHAIIKTDLNNKKPSLSKTIYTNPNVEIIYFNIMDELENKRFEGRGDDRYFGLNFNDIISTKYNHSYNDNYLLEFYEKEDHISILINNHNHVIPACYAIRPKANGDLNMQDIKVTIDKDKFNTSTSLDEYTIPILKDAKKAKERGEKVFNGSVVRLKSINKKSHETIVTIQLASYFDALSTNFTMDHKPQSRSHTLREWLHNKNKKLGSFEKSKLVNHIGVVHMIESTDGMIIVQKRSKKVVNRTCTFSSSASGTLTWTVAEGAINEEGFITAVHKGSLMETDDELGVILDSETYFLGAIRDYERGGMPDFYFFSQSSKSLREIQKSQKTAEESWESDEIIGFEFLSDQVSKQVQSRIEFQKRIDKILKSKELKELDVNLTLYAGLLLTAENVLQRTTQK